MVMIFFDTTSKAQSMQEIIDKVDFLKLQIFFFAKDNVKRMNDKQQTGRKHS